MWNEMKPKIKYTILDGFKNVDIKLKVIRLQCAWVKRLFDNKIRNWKTLPLT